MNKIELKHIVNYLPYGLKYAIHGIKNTSISGIVTTSIVDDTIRRLNEIKDISLVLRPMSDLIKPLPNGEIPLNELAKIYENNEYGYPSTNNWDIKPITITGIYEAQKNCMIFSYFGEDNTITIEEHGKDGVISNPIMYFDYLFKNHFDIYGLIKKGFAIDINKLN